MTSSLKLFSVTIKDSIIDSMIEVSENEEMLAPSEALSAIIAEMQAKNNTL